MTTGPEKALSDWSARALKESKAASPDALDWLTAEGIVVKPVYTAADLAELEHVDSMPGFEPFVRGPRATKYVGRPWTVRQYAIRRKNPSSGRA